MHRVSRDERKRPTKFSRGMSVLDVLVVVLVTWLDCPSAHAYLDPGTGSALLYVISALVLSVYFAARGLCYGVVERLFRIRFKNQKCELAIHSEDPRYETTFLPVLRALAENNVAVSYFTMYERDAGFEALPPHVTHQAIPGGLVGYSYLNHLEAKLLVTTTPQVDVMMFRRSRRVKHYCHIPHALGESRFVRPFAYDFFDSILCCGPLLKQNIRTIESRRGLPEKRLWETGIPHYDELVRKARERTREPGPRTVLVAPSWGPMSLFNVFGVDFVGDIARRYAVVVRPHPQMRISQPDLHERILAMDGVTVDTDASPTNAMARADIVVSDISGIAYEFAFLYERPVLVVDHKLGVGGLEGYLLGDTPTLREICDDFIVAMSPSDMGTLVDRIDDVLRRDLPERIAQARDELVYNFGKAGSAAARQIEGILRCL